MTLREARDIFYKKHGFPKDGGISEDWWSPIGCRDLKVYLPNFEWRRKAIPLHDLHHILTEYPFSPIGEFQISAWEFAAGKYPNIYTTLFCIPLVSLGAIIVPKRTFSAFVRGKQSKSLYHYGKDYQTLLDQTVNDVRKEILPISIKRASLKDLWDYTILVISSAIVILTPFVLFFIIFRIL